MTLKEEREYKLIESGLTYLPDERRWTAKLPWIKDPYLLSNNKAAAMSLLRSTERKLSTSAKQRSLYKSQIDDMIKRHVCRKLDFKEIQEYKGPIYYIAHRAVLKPESKSTPCRIVVRSSAKFSGHILNDYLAEGPDMLNNLLGIVLRFREERVGMVGDISKMYYSIEKSVRPNDVLLSLEKSRV